MNAPFIPGLGGQPPVDVPRATGAGASVPNLVTGALAALISYFASLSEAEQKQLEADLAELMSVAGQPVRDLLFEYPAIAWVLVGSRVVVSKLKNRPASEQVIDAVATAKEVENGIEQE